MDIPLQNIPTAPLKLHQQPIAGAVVKQQEPQIAANTFSKTTTTPTELGTVGAVNVSRIAGQSPSIPEVSSVERILKPYGVTMLPRSANTEKLV